MQVLILGGTGEARALAAQLSSDGVEVMSSLAGRVQNPALPVGEVTVGGFGGAAGLATYLENNDVRLVVDATHPFAATITTNAVTASDKAGVPLLVLRRPAWSADAADNWFTVASIEQAARAVVQHAEAQSTVLLTTGRRDVTAFAGDSERTYLVRSVDPPTVTLPPRHKVILDRGPYTVDGEKTLMRQHNIELLVTKNSGGDMTYAKITAARHLGIPVVIVARPPLPDGAFDTVSDVDAAAAWCHRRLSK